MGRVGFSLLGALRVGSLIVTFSRIGLLLLFLGSIRFSPVAVALTTTGGLDVSALALLDGEEQGREYSS